MPTAVCLLFTVRFLGDGIDTKFIIDMKTKAIDFGGIAPATAPASVRDLAASGPSDVKVVSFTYLLDTITVSLSEAPRVGEIYMLSGIAQY